MHVDRQDSNCICFKDAYVEVIQPYPDTTCIPTLIQSTSAKRYGPMGVCVGSTIRGGGSIKIGDTREVENKGGKNTATLTPEGAQISRKLDKKMA